MVVQHIRSAAKEPGTRLRAAVGAASVVMCGDEGGWCGGHLMGLLAPEHSIRLNSITSMTQCKRKINLFYLQVN